MKEADRAPAAAIVERGTAGAGGASQPFASLQRLAAAGNRALSGMIAPPARALRAQPGSAAPGAALQSASDPVGAEPASASGAELAAEWVGPGRIGPHEAITQRVAPRPASAPRAPGVQRTRHGGGARPALRRNTSPAPSCLQRAPAPRPLAALDRPARGPPPASATRCACQRSAHAASSPSSAAVGRACSGAPVQRSWLDDLGDLGQAASQLRTVVGGLTGDTTAIVHASGLLVRRVWTHLPDSAKPRVVNLMLAAAERVVQAGTTLLQSQHRVLARLLRGAAVGFLRRLRTGVDDDRKVVIADRLIQLWASPSPEFDSGYGRGFLLGLWDGISGPFILLWDLAKLGFAITGALLRLAASLTDPRVRAMAQADIERIGAAVQRAGEEAVQQVLSGQTDPTAIFAMFDRLLAQVEASASGAGSRMADAFVGAIEGANDTSLGHAVGRAHGMILFEVLLLILTEGGYAAAKAAVEGAHGVQLAIQAAARLGRVARVARITEALAPVATAGRRFIAFLRANRVGSRAIEVVEEVWVLFVKYLRLSYGLDAGGARAADDAARLAVAGEGGIVAGRVGGHTVKYSRGLGIVICTTCSGLGERFAVELEEAAGAALRRDLDDLERRMAAAIDANDIPGFDALSTEATALAGRMLDHRVQRLSRLTGMPEAGVQQLLTRLGDDVRLAEEIGRAAGGDAARADRFAADVIATWGNDATHMRRLLREAATFPPAGAPAPQALNMLPPSGRLRPYEGANLPHFADQHLATHFDFAGMGNPNAKTFWPQGTTPADLERYTFEACELLRQPGRVRPVPPRDQVFVQLSNGITVRFGIRPENGRIIVGQLYPAAGPGIRVIPGQDMRTIGRLIGRLNP